MPSKQRAGGREHGGVTREAWLQRAVDDFRIDFDDLGCPLPLGLHVSVGWPTGSRGAAIGQCFPSYLARDGASHIFVSPALDDPVLVLGVMVHELVHAALDCEGGHGRLFGRLARELGLAGRLTATRPGPELRARLNALVGSLGDYPHAALRRPRAAKRQTTRLLKVMAVDECGYTVRVARMWLDRVGFPSCPHGVQMELVE